MGEGRVWRCGAEGGDTLGYGLQCRSKGGDMHDAVLHAFGNPAQVGAFGENDKNLHLRHPERLALCVPLQMSIKVARSTSCILRVLLHRRSTVVLPFFFPATYAILACFFSVFLI